MKNVNSLLMDEPRRVLAARENPAGAAPVSGRREIV
jgi:hypothetical protein